MRRFIFACLLLTVGLNMPAARAQGAAEPVYVPLMIKVVGTNDEFATETSTLTATVSTDPQPPAATGTLNISTWEFNFPPQILPVEMGKETELVISGEGIYASSFTLTPPPGYTLLIDGLERKTRSVSGYGTFKVRVLPALNAAVAPAGTATELTAGQVKWGVSLGSEKNGQSIGWLWLIGSGVSDWAPFFQVNNLYFEQDSDELVVHKLSGGIKRQIRTNEAFVDLIAPTTPAATNVPAVTGAAFEIRFYHPSSMTTSGSLRTPLANKQPFVIYRVTDTTTGGVKGLKIEKKVCSLDPSPTPVILRTEVTTLTRSGPDNTSYVWTAKGWTLDGQSAVASTVSTWSSITDGHRDVFEVRDASESVVARARTEHTVSLAGLPRLPTSVTAAPDTATAVTGTTSYYADQVSGGTTPDPSKRYRIGFPQMTTSTGGAWSAITYIDPTIPRTPAIPTADRDKWLGVVDTTFSPFLDAAAPNLAINATPSLGAGMLATRLDYAKDVFGYPSRVTLVESSYKDPVTSTTRLISKSTTTYANTSAAGRSAIDTERTDYAGDGLTIKNTRIYFREDDSQSFWRNQSFKETSATGAKISYLRERGAFATAVTDTDAPLGFIRNNNGASSRIGVITGASSSNMSVDTESTLTTTCDGGDISDLYLLPGRSTLSLTYRDAYARVVRTESHIRTTSATWQLVGWENYTYNTRNQLTKRTNSSGDVHELFYTGEYLTREVDALGVETTYDYDVAGRQWKSTRSAFTPGPALVSEFAFAPRPALVTESVFDAADRVVEQRTYAADDPSLKSVTTRVYDLAGRVVSEKSSGSPEIITDYNPAARTTTVTNTATFATKTNETYLDGQPKSVTGTAVVEERYAYGFESDGRRRSEATSGPITSTRKVKSWSDWLGRNTLSERPAPPLASGDPGGTVSTATFYHASTGLPIRGTSPLSAATLTTYDVVGEPKLSGLDADGSGALEPVSARDRITGTRKSVVFAENAWWATSESFTYATAGSATETIVGKSWTRLTGLTGGLVGETRSWDTEGNLTRRTVERDRTNRKITTRTWLPGLANPQIDASIDGLATKSTAPDGLIASTTYDSLRRPEISTTPRSGETVGTRTLVTTYKLDGAQATGLVETVADQTRVSTTVYDAAFRPFTTINPDNQSVTQFYNARGQVTHVFGSATSPVRYVYDDAYGQRIEQHTFRDTSATYSANGYNDVSQFPAANADETDRVVWEHDPATGLLLKKTDPLGRFVKYTYDTAGRISARRWARHKNPDIKTEPTTDDERLTAIPTYDSATGDLLSTDYTDDATPTVSTTYDRLGRPLTITDAIGTRTYLRDTEKPWRTIAELLPEHYGTGRVLSWLYEEQGGGAGDYGFVQGRSRGFQVGTIAQPAALLGQSTLWTSTGRLKSITTGRDNFGSNQTFAYTYTDNSRLLKSVTALGTGFEVSRLWDPVRDLLTKIETKSGTRTLASYAYTHTSLGQRHNATQSGEAFAADPADPAETTTTYAYNFRGEVTSALTGVGNATAASAARIPGRKFAFDYDLAGNRLRSTHQGDLTGAYSVGYTVGKGNELTKRDNPAVSVSGVATPAAQVTVDTTVVPPSGRQGRHWQQDLVPDESASESVPDDAGTSPAPVEFPRKARQVTALASVVGGGSGGADLASFDRFELLLSPRDEQLRYDRDGNLLRDGTWAYTWDAENRLVRMESHEWLFGRARQKLEFAYDYQGRRVTKRVRTWPVGAPGYSSPVETRYLYDGWNLIAEFTSSSTFPLNWSVARSYTWGLDLVGSLTASGGVGALVQITDHAEGQTYLPGYDGNGNVTVLVRASDGYRAAAYEYGPYGEVLRSEGTYATRNPFRFSTKYTDVESGLVYYGMRYYDARNGRFINRDPIEERGGLNLYGFCGNDGVNRYDVLGMSWLSKAWKKVKKWMAKHQWAAAVAGLALGLVTGFYATAWANVFLGPAATIGNNAVIFGSTVGGMVGGSSSAALSGARGSDILRSGVIGAATAGISAGVLHNVSNGALRIAGHTAIGGAASVASGGRFGPGALASGLTIGLGVGHLTDNPLLNTFASAGMGGAISRATGGDFTTGAVTAGLQAAYNDNLFERILRKFRPKPPSFSKIVWGSNDTYKVEEWRPDFAEYPSWGPVRSRWAAIARYGFNIESVQPDGSDSMELISVEKVYAEYEFEVKMHYSVYDKMSGELLRYDSRLEPRYAYRDFRASVGFLQPSFEIGDEQYKIYNTTSRMLKGVSVPNWNGSPVPSEEWLLQPRSFSK